MDCPHLEIAHSNLISDRALARLQADRPWRLQADRPWRLQADRPWRLLSADRSIDSSN